jgi:hypothetical protein
VPDDEFVIIFYLFVFLFITAKCAMRPMLSSTIPTRLEPRSRRGKFSNKGSKSIRELKLIKSIQPTEERAGDENDATQLAS